MELNKLHQKESETLLSNSSEKVMSTDTIPSNTHSTTKLSYLQLFSSLRVQYPIRFIVLCAQVFFYYIAYGYLQELLFILEGFDKTAWFLTCYQFLIYGILSFTQIGFVGLTERRASYQSYILLAILTVSTMGLSNYSIGFLNYPTQVMFKCCKLIPVLIGGIIIQQKRFNRYDVAAAICMSIGLIFFTLADSKVQPNFNTYGVVLICLALIADAIIGNYQEKVMKTYHVSNAELVFYSFIFGFLIILIGLLITDNLFSSITFWNQHPLFTYGYGLFFAIFGYLGIDIVLTLIKEYGALICVTVTTCRKAITIVLSFTLFSKPFVFDYVWSGLIVVLGIYLNIYSRNQAMFNAKVASYAGRVFGSKILTTTTTTTTSSRTLPV